MDSIERELDRLFSLSGRHPMLFWQQWDELVSLHRLDRKQAETLMSRRNPPPRPAKPLVAVGRL